MNLAKLINLITYRFKIASTSTEELEVIYSVIDQIIEDICMRPYSWSFLKKLDTSMTMAANDYQKALPSDFLRLSQVSLLDSNNILRAVFGEKAEEFDKSSPDVTKTGRPYQLWVYNNPDDGKPYIELRPKSDDTYTLYIRYFKSIAKDQVDLIPNGLVVFWGCGSVLAPSDEYNNYYQRYENGIVTMAQSDMINLSEEGVLKPDPNAVAINKYMEDL